MTVCLKLLIFFLVSKAELVKANVKTGAIKCPLTWTSFTLGDIFPDDAVSTKNFKHNKNSNIGAATSSEEAIIRSKIFGKWTLGVADRHQIGLFHQKQSFEKLSYEILTNSNNCSYEWVPLTNRTAESLTLRFSDEISFVKIGRFFINELWMPCLISEDTSSRSIFSKKINTRNNEFGTNHQKLIAYNLGLNLQLRNISFRTQEEKQAVEFLGTDILHNKANTEITQSVSHSKSVIKSLKIDFHFNWKLSLGLVISVNGSAESPGNPKKTFFWHWGQNFIITDTTTKEVKVTTSNDIIVPPYTSVESISIVRLHEFLLIIMSEGAFSAPGHTSHEIETILREAGQTGPFKHEGNSIVIQVNASLKGTAPMSSEFRILPHNALNVSRALEVKTELEIMQKEGNSTFGSGINWLSEDVVLKFLEF